MAGPAWRDDERFLTSPRLRGERLSLRSSVFWLPWGFVSQDCVEDGEQLSGDGDDGDELGLSSGDEPVAEELELGIEAGGDQGAHDQSPAYAGSAAANEALAAPLAGLPGPGRQPGKGSNLPTIERTQLRHFGNQGTCDGRTDAGHRGQQVFLLGPGRGAPHVIGNVVIQFRQLFLQRLA